MPRPLIWPVRAWPPWAGAAAVVLGLHLVVLVWVAGRTPTRPALPTWPTAWVQVRLASEVAAAAEVAGWQGDTVLPARGRPPTGAQASAGGEGLAVSPSSLSSPDAARRPAASPAARASPDQAQTNAQAQAFPGGDQDTAADAKISRRRQAVASVGASVAAVAASVASPAAQPPGNAGALAHARQRPGRPPEVPGTQGAAAPAQDNEPAGDVARSPNPSSAAWASSPVAGPPEPAPVVALADAAGEAADLSVPPPLYPVHWPAARRVAYAGHHGRRPVQAELHWRPDLPGGALASYHLALVLAAAPASQGLAAAAATTAAPATATQIAGPFLLQQQSQGQLPSHGLAPERLLDRRQGRGARAVNLRWPAATARAEPGSALGAASPLAAAPVRPEAGPTPDRSPVPNPDAGLWGTGELSFSASTARWPAWPGTQDRLSWLLQLAAVAHAAALAGSPPLPWVELLVADASGGIARWRLVHQGEVLQPLPGGTRRLQHWRHSPAQPDALWVEAWLDPAQSHWPAGWRYHWPRTGARLELWQTSPNPP